MKVSAIVFDLDETLIDRHSAVTAFAQSLWSAHLSASADSPDTFISRVHAIDGHGYTPRPEFFEQMWNEFSEHVPAKDNIQSAFYEQVWETPRLAGGVKEALHELKASGVPLAIVSNGSTKAQATKIEKSGIRDFFDLILVSEEFGVKKPDPSIYLAAAEHFNTDPSQCWFVGDHPVNDIWGSKQVGFKTAWIHLGRPWAAHLEPCYDVAGKNFEQTMLALG